ncbi:MAG TPA: tripartite tricarboxylate transporter TctB family protein [Vicinamibacterales bacterium]
MTDMTPGRARIGQNVGAGLMFVAAGLGGLYLSQDLEPGSALRMGPGYFPRLLCWLLVAAGVIIALRGAIAGDSAIARWHLRPLVFVLGGVMAFRYLIEPAGLALASVVTVLLCAAASREFRLREAIVLSIGLAVGAIAVFVYALRLPMAVWPW